MGLRQPTSSLASCAALPACVTVASSPCYLSAQLCSAPGPLQTLLLPPREALSPAPQDNLISPPSPASCFTDKGSSGQLHQALKPPEQASLVEALHQVVWSVPPNAHLRAGSSVLSLLEVIGLFSVS